MDKNTKLLISIGAASIISFLIMVSVLLKGIDSAVNIPVDGNFSYSDSLKRFSSIKELREKIEKALPAGRGGFFENTVGMKSMPLVAQPESAAKDASVSVDYSQTNVQVAGVDEADIVKTDGNYIYTLSGKYITISQAYPGEDAQMMSKIELAQGSSPQELFIEGDNILVFGSRYHSRPYDSSAKSELKRSLVYPYSTNVTFVEIYNVSDRKNPQLERKLEFDGGYKTSRKIGDNVYFVLNHYPQYHILSQEISDETFCAAVSPQYREGIDMNNDTAMKPLTDCLNVRYIEPLRDFQMATIVRLSISNYDKPLEKETILGGGENVYASKNNMYLIKTDYDYGDSNWPEILPRERRENTQIYKLAIDRGKIDFERLGTVPGRVLNQFSMDEYDGYFRIATTVGHATRDNKNSSSNNVYVLDQNLEKVGAIENIAPGEQIYSVRFMGKRGFLVTFKKVDPFFTLDLENPKNPRLIGKLKIPGYSDYLHPYDENHIIGIGKNTVEASENLSGTTNFAWYQGMKMAIFDVSDFSNPKEMFKVEIGDRGTDSPILSDHKALLFSREKNLLVIPILEAQLTPEQRIQNKEGNAYGDFVYQGAYVFDIDLDDGFNLRGRVTHFDNEDVFKKSGYYFGSQDNSIKRSLYINDNLYTVSNAKISINKLEDLSSVKDINFNLPATNYNYPMYE